MLELEIQILPGRLVVVRRTDMAGRRTTFEPQDGRYRPLMVDHAQLAELLLARRFDEYGARLWELLFAEPGLATFYEQARAGGHLRVILDIAASEPELHGLLWEAMHASDAPPVAFDEGLTFVRYLSSRTWRERPLAGECEIALMFPSSSAGYRRLGLRDEAGEAASLADLAAQITAATPSAPGWRLRPKHGVSRSSLIAALEGRDPAKVVCLVCHGRMDRGAAFLALDAEDGAAVAMVEVEALARAVAEAESGPGIPSLVILAACQTAGEGGNEPAQAFGSAAIRLVRAGIPCVLAVHGDVDKRVIVQFLREFLASVLGEGSSLEAAVQSARASLARNPTFGDTARSHAIQPVLYSRASGDYGLVPRQRARSPEDEEQLGKLVDDLADLIAMDQVVPVIGPTFAEVATGTRRELAQYFARKFRYPTEDDAGLALETVLQYVKMTENAVTARVNLPQEVERRIAHHVREHLGLPKDGNESLRALQDRVAVHWTEGSEYSALARLPFPRYVMVSPDRILESMVAAMDGVTLENECHRWREVAGGSEKELPAEPTRERPVFYSLFGRLGDPRTWPHMVLTEDDCFDYLMTLKSMTRRPSDTIVAAMQTQGLLLLGMRVEDFQTRLLMQIMEHRINRDNPNGAPSLCVQLDPVDVDADRRAALSRYIQNYMQSKGKLQIVWCQPREFLARLVARVGELSPDRLRTVKPHGNG